MGIDFNMYPGCMNCSYCRRTLDIVNTQESEPSNVIDTFVTSTLVSYRPAQALGHDSAAVSSTLITSPVQALGHDSPVVGSSLTSSPVQALGNDFASVSSTLVTSSIQARGNDSPVVGSTSTSYPVQALGHDSAAVDSTSTSYLVQALGHDSAAGCSTLTSSPVHSSSAISFESPPAPTKSVFFGSHSQRPAFQAPVQATFGSVTFRSSISFPAPSSFNLFEPNVSTTASDFETPTFCSNSNIESHPEWSCCPAKGSRFPGYRPTPVIQTQNGDIYVSISASYPYQHKSHEELRWEDYTQGAKGRSFPPAYVSPIGPKPKAVVSPSVFDSRSIGTTGVYRLFPAAGGETVPVPSTTFPHINSSILRHYETAAVSSSAPGCTACGATTSSSASGSFTLNGATAPPSAARYIPMFFFPTSGSGPMMFGTTLADQATTPTLEAYPVQGYIILPFSALRLQ